jgi:hypothetical protein
MSELDELLDSITIAVHEQLEDASSLSTHEWRRHSRCHSHNATRSTRSQATMGGRRMELMVELSRKSRSSLQKG